MNKLKYIKTYILFYDDNTIDMHIKYLFPIKLHS